MKIKLETRDDVEETEINIICKSITPEIEKIISTLRLIDKQLVVKKEAETFIIKITEILYIETVDKRTFVYTKSNVYETILKLYELEDEYRMFRASKSCIINLGKIKSLKADFDRRIKVTMENNEQIIVSRQYAEKLKQVLGVS